MASVLIIDDNTASRTALSDILQDLGYTTIEASDARSGINLYREKMPDVVMLEMLMPEKDGFETLFDIRKICAGAKIIMMTGGGRITIDIYQRLARSLQIPELLVKPLVADEVASAIAIALSSEAEETGNLRMMEEP
jgi:DNA-binding NtrC family response regulator